jgi:hypothetical protein
VLLATCFASRAYGRQLPASTDDRAKIRAEIRKAEAAGDAWRALELKGALEAENNRIAEREAALRIPTPAERARMKARLFPDFRKDAAKFSAIAGDLRKFDDVAVLDESGRKSVRKSAKELEKYASRLLRFLLDGEEPIGLRQTRPATSTVEQRIDALMALVASAQDGLRSETANAATIDVEKHLALLKTLQSIRLICISLAS